MSRAVPQGAQRPIAARLAVACPAAAAGLSLGLGIWLTMQAGRATGMAVLITGTLVFLATATAWMTKRYGNFGTGQMLILALPGPLLPLPLGVPWTVLMLLGAVFNHLAWRGRPGAGDPKGSVLRLTSDGDETDTGR